MKAIYLTIAALFFALNLTAQDRCYTFTYEDTICESDYLLSEEIAATGLDSGCEIAVELTAAKDGELCLCFDDCEDSSFEICRAIETTEGTDTSCVIVDFVVEEPTCDDFTESDALCEYVANNPDSNLAAADCDAGGVDNATECENRADPLNPDDDTTTELQSDLAVTKTADPTEAVGGDTVIFTLTAINNGADNEPNALVTDVLPADLTFVNATPSVGTYDSTTGEWTIGALANGATETLVIETTVATGATFPILNTATIAGDNVDNDTDNNTATVEVAEDSCGGNVVDGFEITCTEIRQISSCTVKPCSSGSLANLEITHDGGTTTIVDGTDGSFNNCGGDVNWAALGIDYTSITGITFIGCQ